MNYRLLGMCVIALACAGCGQKTPIGDVPENFYYKGSPVDPACFVDSAAQMGDAISLSVCTGKNKTAPEYKENHFYGVDIDDSNGGVSSTYSYYRYLGESDGNAVIQTLMSSGGVSQYSSVRLMTLDGDLLHTTKRIAGGDRCAGGITDASVSGGTVSYTKNITPFDLATIASANDPAFKSGTDLDSSADTCVGTATYEGDELKKVTLTMDPKDFPSDQTPKGACFVNVYKNTYKPNATLDFDKVSDFGIDLNTQCGPLNKDH